MTERSFLGRGYEPTPGKPFGYAWHQERAEIREHLKRRGRWNDARDEFTVTRIQQRLHRNKPTLRERQAAWHARQPKTPGASLSFTWEELERIAEHFAGANDPVTASIAAKAQEALNRKD